MRDYFDELNKINIADRIGRHIFIHFELEGDIEEWSNISAGDVLAVVQSTLVWPSIESWLSNSNVGRTACLAGISFWLNLRRCAEAWAIDILSTWVDRAGGDHDAIPTNHNEVDWAINAESENVKELWEVRAFEPLLYGEICLETQRRARSLAQ